MENAVTLCRPMKLSIVSILWGERNGKCPSMTVQMDCKSACRFAVVLAALALALPAVAIELGPLQQLSEPGEPPILRIDIIGGNVLRLARQGDLLISLQNFQIQGANTTSADVRIRSKVLRDAQGVFLRLFVNRALPGKLLSFRLTVISPKTLERDQRDYSMVSAARYWISEQDRERLREQRRQEVTAMQTESAAPQPAAPAAPLSAVSPSGAPAPATQFEDADLQAKLQALERELERELGASGYVSGTPSQAQQQSSARRPARQPPPASGDRYIQVPTKPPVDLLSVARGGMSANATYTPWQLAISLYQFNPHAFEGGLISGLYPGSRLSIPPSNAIGWNSPASARRMYDRAVGAVPKDTVRKKRKAMDPPVARSARRKAAIPNEVLAAVRVEIGQLSDSNRSLQEAVSQLTEVVSTIQAQQKVQQQRLGTIEQGMQNITSLLGLDQRDISDAMKSVGLDLNVRNIVYSSGLSLLLLVVLMFIAMRLQRASLRQWMQMENNQMGTVGAADPFPSAPAPTPAASFSQVVGGGASGTTGAAAPAGGMRQHMPEPPPQPLSREVAAPAPSPAPPRATAPQPHPLSREAAPLPQASAPSKEGAPQPHPLSREAAPLPQASAPSKEGSPQPHPLSREAAPLPQASTPSKEVAPQPHSLSREAATQAPLPASSGHKEQAESTLKLLEASLKMQNIDAAERYMRMLEQVGTDQQKARARKLIRESEALL